MAIYGILFNLLLFVACIRGSGVATYSDLDSKLNQIDVKFKEKGASFEILDDYEEILLDINHLDKSDIDNSNKLNNLVNKINYKHGLVNLILYRDFLAFKDFSSCLPSNENIVNGINKLCLKNYVDLGLKFGKLDEIAKFIEVLDNDSESDSELIGKFEYYNNNLNELNKSIADNEWNNCIQISNDLLKIGKFDSKIIDLKIQCLIKSDKDIDLKIILIKNEFNKLINLNSEDEKILGNFEKLIMIEIFQNSNNVDKYLKKCLKFNNDYQECKNLNRINLKINKILKIVNKISIYYSFIYNESNNESINNEKINDLEVSKSDWKNLNSLLFSSDEKIQLKNRFDHSAFEEFGLNNIEDNYKNNFEILIDLFFKFLKHLKFQDDEIRNSKYLNDLLKMGKESFYQIGEGGKFVNQFKNSKFFNEYYKERDLIDISKDLDKLIKKKDMNKIEEILKELSDSMKLSNIVKKRLEKIEGLKQQQQQQQQQHQQQQHQQQHQFRQQQQQQQRANPNSKPFKPKNDYYKILGVDKKADESEIKKAYRQQMRENHPDKVSGKGLSEEEVETKVANINNAYEILSDPETREKYDKYGEDPLDPENAQKRHEWEQSQRFNGGGNGGSYNFQFSGNGGHGNGNGFPGGGSFEDIFRNFGAFGGGGGGSRGKPNGKAKMRRNR